MWVLLQDDKVRPICFAGRFSSISSIDLTPGVQS